VKKSGKKKKKAKDDYLSLRASLPSMCTNKPRVARDKKNPLDKNGQGPIAAARACCCSPGSGEWQAAEKDVCVGAALSSATAFPASMMEGWGTEGEGGRGDYCRKVF
jgi:hypothetical protein